MTSKWIDPELYADRASRGKCARCGAPVIKGRAGLVMALDVRLDPEPVLDESWVQGTDRLLWCVRGKRILWHDHRRCGNRVYADHQCDEGDDMSEEDPFGLGSAQAKQKSPYAGMTHPVTGKVIGRHVRATNYIKGLSDDFSLQQWMKRMVVKGLAGQPEVIEELWSLDVKRDATRIDAICAEAKRAAGGDDAAAAGTHLHSQTEYADRGQWERVDDESLPQVKKYQQALQDKGIIIIPELIERKVWHTGLVSQVTGSFDRIVRLSDGGHAILDVKTGSLDPDQYMEKWLTIAAQLAIYQEAVNAHGVWNEATRSWQKLGFTARSDFAIVAHLPAKGSGCELYTVGLEEGRRALDALRVVREARKLKGFVEPYVAPVGDRSSRVQEFLTAISLAPSKELLILTMQEAKDAGIWGPELSEACKARAKVIAERA